MTGRGIVAIGLPPERLEGSLEARLLERLSGKRSVVTRFGIKTIINGLRFRIRIVRSRIAGLLHRLRLSVDIMTRLCFIARCLAGVGLEGTNRTRGLRGLTRVANEVSGIGVYAG